MQRSIRHKAKSDSLGQILRAEDRFESQKSLRKPTESALQTARLPGSVCVLCRMLELNVVDILGGSEFFASVVLRNVNDLLPRVDVLSLGRFQSRCPFNRYRHQVGRAGEQSQAPSSCPRIMKLIPVATEANCTRTSH